MRINLPPGFCDPPHRITHPEKLDDLTADMATRGWHGAPLTGYLLDRRVQLISGSHRLVAAARAGIPVPVRLHSETRVRRAWGTDAWPDLF